MFYINCWDNFLGKLILPLLVSDWQNVLKYTAVFMVLFYKS